MNETHEVVWLAPDGTVLPDQAGASACEVLEYLDGVPVRRTYADLDATPVEQTVAAPDWVRDDEDQTKGSWDLYLDGAPVDTRAQLFTLFEWDGLPVAGQRALLCDVLELPSWDAAPERLQGECYEWLRHTGAQAGTKALAPPRDARRDDAARAMDRAEADLADVLARFYDRQVEVLVARLRGPKARRGTRHWKDGS